MGGATVTATAAGHSHPALPRTGCAIRVAVRVGCGTEERESLVASDWGVMPGLACDLVGTMKE